MLVLDTSGSMNEEGKIQSAREGLKQLVQLLDDGDTFSFPCPSAPDYTGRSEMRPSKPNAQIWQRRSTNFSLVVGTTLYDAIGSAYQQLASARPGESKIEAVVVLTDGEDTQSKMKLGTVDGAHQVQWRELRPSINTISLVAEDACKDILQKIADATRAKFYVGTPQNIVEVFRDISTFTQLCQISRRICAEGNSSWRMVRN